MSLEDAELAALFASKKKKKKSGGGGGVSATGGAAEAGTQDQDTAEETYDDLLHNIYIQMGYSEKELQLSSLKLKPPKVERIGGKKTSWMNFRTTAEGLKRAEDHLSFYISSELGVLVSITQEGCLLLRGIFASSKIESCLRKYIENYVKCPMCKSHLTEIKKDLESRLSMIHCSRCFAVRSVAPITTGFHATMKGERKKAAAADD